MTTKLDGSSERATLLVCDCAGTMSIDGAALGSALGREAAVNVCTLLCRRELPVFEAALKTDDRLLVACTQEAPLFDEVAGDAGHSGARFVNIRERAGWSADGAATLPKMAALIADVEFETQPTRLMSITSDGQCLVYGRGQAALDVAKQLAGRLSVSVLLLDAGDAMPLNVANVPVHTGKVRGTRGSFGGFELNIDSYGSIDPSSRHELRFEPLRDGAATTCDLILDITGDAPLFIDGDGRDGYLRAEPSQPAALAEAMFTISDMIGEFEKPIYVSYDADICAHSRSGKIGCRNCIDACPKGAIQSAGDNVEIDPGICGGCGNCSASCPTGAVTYDYPTRHDLMRRLQILVAAYRGAGGTAPELLLHDEQHGADLIAAMARYGRGLPANVIPVALHAVTEVGHDTIAAALAFGFQRVNLLASPAKMAELDALTAQCDLARAMLQGLGYAGERIALLIEDDPDAVEAALFEERALEQIAGRIFAPEGGKRDVTRLALSALHEMAPQPADVIALPAGAPYGRLDINVEGCTLCLACVGACPAAALNADDDKPRLSFAEQACVQCGLCVATCPEKVIRLEPRYNFAGGLTPETVKEEEPFECIRCSKPFGTKSTIETIVAKLEGRHSMFQGTAQVDLIRMCDNCRVIAMSESDNDPMKLGERPKMRTTDDYIMEAEAERAAAKNKGEA
ncbi:MAG: 4Fe-4S dicluster domain-containing protein [Hyphomicrobiaceae bacterium]